MITLNSEQREAVDKMHEFLKGKNQMFMLEGSAGTGKTTCVQTLLRETPDKVFALSAPTNKATKVLREVSEREGITAECRTIYSLLGLRISKDSEFVQIEPLGDSAVMDYDVVVIDESSMVNAKLFDFVCDAVAASDVKIIFMCDPLQLPPVKEARSPTLEIRNKFVLSKVERHDNQILAFATGCPSSRTTPITVKPASSRNSIGAAGMVRVVRADTNVSDVARTVNLPAGSPTMRKVPLASVRALGRTDSPARCSGQPSSGSTSTSASAIGWPARARTIPVSTSPRFSTSATG